MLQQRKMNDIGAAVTNKGVWPCGVWVQWHTTLPAARFVKRHWFGFNHLLHNSGSNEFKGLSAKHDVLWITWPLWYCGSIFLHFSSMTPHQKCGMNPPPSDPARPSHVATSTFKCDVAATKPAVEGKNPQETGCFSQKLRPMLVSRPRRARSSPAKCQCYLQDVPIQL